MQGAKHRTDKGHEGGIESEEETDIYDVSFDSDQGKVSRDPAAGNRQQCCDQHKVGIFQSNQIGK